MQLKTGDVKPGDIVMLKSGGPALTVAEVDGEAAECIWIGEEGDLYRETLPLVVLESAVLSEDERENGEHEDEDEEEEEDERDVA